MSDSSTAAASKSEALDGIVPFSLSSDGGVGGAGSWVVSHALSRFQKDEALYQRSAPAHTAAAQHVAEAGEPCASMRAGALGVRPAREPA